MAGVLDGGVKLKGPAEVFIGARCVAKALASKPTVEIGKRETGIQGEGLRKRLSSLFRLPGVEVRVAEVIGDQRIAGVEFKRGPVIGESLRVLAAARLNIGPI